MSNLDRPVFGLLEQLSSTDLNDVSNMGSHTLLDALRYAANLGLTTSGAETLRDVVLGGLTALRTAAGVDVQPGALLQSVWTLGAGTQPLPSDSQSLLARLSAAGSVALPVLGADTWYLVQARCAESVQTVNRLFWNNTTKVFDVATTTIVENVIELGSVVGSTNVPVPINGWVALCAVLVRASGAFAQSDVIDLRPLAGNQFTSSSGEEVMLKHELRSNFGFPSDVPSSFGLSFDVDVVDRGGRRMFARVQSDTTNFTLSALFAPGLVLSNATWYYLYLCRWNSAYTPRGAYSGVTSQGVLVVSSVPPSAQGRRDNSAAITLPAPWSAVPVPAGEAVCIAALPSDPANATGLGFRGIVVRAGIMQCDLPFGLLSVFDPEPGMFLNDSHLPRNARAFRTILRCDGTTGSVNMRIQTPQVSPTRQVRDAYDRADGSLHQLSSTFDCRGILPSAIWTEGDVGIALGRIYETEI